MTDYLNDPRVKTSLNIKYEKEWTPCNQAINYTKSVFGSQWIYPMIIEKGYQVLIYSGNSDTIVPTVGTHRWVMNLNMTITKEWGPWFTQTS